MSKAPQFTNKELERYARQLVLKDFGPERQAKLLASSVLVIGAGGLGAPVLLYLAAAGVGKLGVVDDDKVQLSNLQRQVLFTMEDIGINKAIAAKQRLHKLNPELHIDSFDYRITSSNAMDLVRGFDLVIDCSDNFPTRYLANDVCVLCDRPLVYGAILEFEGQLAVLNAGKDGTRTATYRDLFPEPPDPENAPNCEQVGVLGILPGLVGCLMANEAIKLITGVAEPMSDQLLIVDALSLEFTKIKIPDRGTRDSITTLIDYEDFCGISSRKAKTLNMNECTVHELKEWISNKEDVQLIDVREPYEHDGGNIGGELIPLAHVPDNIDRISKARKVVVYCRSGNRSRQVILWLEKNHGFENLVNLRGGISAWAREIDPSVPVY